MDDSTLGSLSEELDALYQKKEFGAYIEKLKDHRESIHETVFHYNLGTAYLKLDQLGLGRFHLEKLKKLGVLDGRVNKNLDFARSKIAVADSPLLFERGVNVFVGFDFQHHLFITLILLLGSLLLWRRFMARSLKLLPLVLVFSSLGMVPHFLLRDYQSGIVIEEGSLREGPSEAFEEMSAVVPAGTKVIVSRQDGPWRLVRYPRRLSGWILSEKLGIL